MGVEEETTTRRCGKGAALGQRGKAIAEAQPGKVDQSPKEEEKHNPPWPQSTVPEIEEQGKEQQNPPWPQRPESAMSEVEERGRINADRW
ncbi:hypothetical protein BHE74_00021028 [Ensete ventricosum]|nr:hypothetical protein GW17_00027317 [Ensete ventricosum]RWW71245.1 hypothetical protein BHE74_00021028 [Ensete ventricosum]